MSEVDRLSNSGLYPALPMAEKRNPGEGDGKPPRPRQAPLAARVEPESEQESVHGQVPKSTIDEYA